LKTDSLKLHLPQKEDRQKFLCIILQYIYGIPKAETKPPKIPQYL